MAIQSLRAIFFKCDWSNFQNLSFKSNDFQFDLELLDQNLIKLKKDIFSYLEA